MKLNIKQGSQEWLELRKKKITATDCAVIMGLNPWQTPYGLWMQKMGLAPPNEENEAMREGRRLEPIALERFNWRIGAEFVPAVIINPEREWQMASLDGMYENAIVEIKCGAKALEMAKQGIIPDYYKAQLQHQMSVVEVDRMFYYASYGDEDVSIPVERDPIFIGEMLEKEIAFYKCLQECEPPAMSKGDYIEKLDDKWNVCASGYTEALEGIKFLEEQKEYWKKQLIDLSENKNCKGAGISLSKRLRKGTVNYNSIPEIKHINLDNYRKPALEYWQIAIA